MNKKRALIISSIIFVIVVTTLFISYGFITSEVFGNDGSKKAVFNSKIIKVEYSDGTEVLNSKQSVFTPGSTLTKTFTIKNTGNESVKYSINLDNITNTFNRKNDITYELYSNDIILKNGMYDAKGVFPDSKLTILNKDILEVGDSKTYTLKINYLNTEENQIIDSGKSLSARVGIEESKTSIKKLLVYGNSVQDTLKYGSPTPSNPVEIQSVGDRTVNLLPYPYDETTKQGIGITWTDNGDGSVTAEGTSTGYAMFKLSGFKIKLESGKKYYLKASGERDNILLVFAYLDENGTRKYGGSGLTWSDSYSNPDLYLQVNPGNSVSATFFPYFVEESNNSMDYEPYGYKIPIEVSGKNIFDGVFKYGNINANSGESTEYSESSYIFTPNYLSIKPNTKYTMTNEIANLYQKVRFYDKDKNYIGHTFKSGAWLAQNNSSLVRTGTTPDNAYYVRFELDFNDKETATAVLNGDYKYMLEEGETVTDYEPYVEPVTNNIYLNEPLKKIGDCETCSDYIDFENSIIYRNINRVKATSELSWSYQSSKPAFYANKDDTPNSVEGKKMSTHFELKAMWSLTNEDTTTVGLFSNTTELWIRYPFVSIIKDFTDWLDSQNNLGTPVYVDYVMKTPILEEITIPSLSVNNGTNNISVCSNNGVCASNIEVEYDK